MSFSEAGDFPEDWPVEPLRRSLQSATDGPFGSSLTSAHYVEGGARVVRLGNLGIGEFKNQDKAYISLEYFETLKSHSIIGGDLLVAGLGDENNPLGRASLAPDWIQPAIVKADCFRLRLRPGRYDPRFVVWYLSSTSGLQQALLKSRGSTRQRMNVQDAQNLLVPRPSLDEQRRIADFLDAETSRIDEICELKREQRALLDARFSQLLDGAVAGDSEVLQALDCSEDKSEWTLSKLTRLCTIIPGYAFPSEGFRPSHTGVRLLRGTNVGVGRTDWTDIVTWDLQSSPIPDRFHLKPGDLVIGMDRPWINAGIRLSFIQPSDLPALLLQRVACLRPWTDVSMSYVRWALSSRQFRSSIEHELTGVSVPHLSGDQIGDFRFQLPPSQTQRCVAEALETQSQATAAFSRSVDEQLDLLAERRQALITAAVTGQFDVSTARGADLS